MEQLKEAVLRDRMPLISLLQLQPLQMQAAHLSFQEYFVARALCTGEWRLPSPPWEWSAFWDNTLDLGTQMGEHEFGSGLLRAAGLDAGAAAV